MKISPLNVCKSPQINAQSGVIHGPMMNRQTHKYVHIIPIIILTDSILLWAQLTVWKLY